MKYSHKLADVVGQERIFARCSGLDGTRALVRVDIEEQRLLHALRTRFLKVGVGPLLKLNCRGTSQRCCRRQIGSSLAVSPVLVHNWKNTPLNSLVAHAFRSITNHSSFRVKSSNTQTQKLVASVVLRLRDSIVYESCFLVV